MASGAQRITSGGWSVASSPLGDFVGTDSAPCRSHEDIIKAHSAWSETARACAARCTGWRCAKHKGMQTERREGLHMRRARWRDFEIVADLVAQCGAGELRAERCTLRRFRHIVNDLGNDLYLAFLRETLVGLVHIVYVRELIAPRRAEISCMLVAPHPSGQDVTEALLALAFRRAQKRDCRVLVYRLAEAGDEMPAPLVAAGFRLAGQWYFAPVSEGVGGGQQEEH